VVLGIYPSIILDSLNYGVSVLIFSYDVTFNNYRVNLGTVSLSSFTEPNFGNRPFEEFIVKKCSSSTSGYDICQIRKK
jgi:hypothetical protein